MKICYLLAALAVSLSFALRSSAEFLLWSSVIGWAFYGWSTYARQLADRAATTDPLCGVGNRRSLDRAVVRCARSGKTWSALVVDCNGFKRVNDELGHDVGDRILSSVARHIQDSVRAFDHVSRPGGDEFVVVMPDCDVVSASRVAERVSRFFDSGVTLSVGAADSDGGDPIKSADGRMYAAKRSAKPDAV